VIRPFEQAERAVPRSRRVLLRRCCTPIPVLEVLDSRIFIIATGPVRGGCRV